MTETDHRRDHLAGLPATGRARPEHPTEEFTHATYDLLGEEALGRLRQGRVILDATCHSPGQRKLLLDHLKLPGSTYLIVHCQTTLEIALRRAAERMHMAEHVSDATPDIVARQFCCFQSPDELPVGSVLTLSTELPLDLQAAKVARAVDERLKPWQGASTPQ